MRPASRDKVLYRIEREVGGNVVGDEMMRVSGLARYKSVGKVATASLRVNVYDSYNTQTERL
jgi:hypothetical protein